MLRNALLIMVAATMLGACASSAPPTREPAPVATPPLEQPAVPDSLPSVRFPSGGIELNALQRQQVREIADVLKAPELESVAIRVTGHTDSVGSKTANRTIGLRRARAVARELVFNGVSPERLTVDSLGQAEPVAPNTHQDGSDNPEGRALNRRVEIVMQD